MFTFVAITCLVGAVAAVPSGYGGIGYAAEIGSVAIPRYGFNYAVNDPVTGDNKAQSESRDGGVVKGSYSLTEPDGTLRVVDYTADDVSGFNAVVKRIGPAAHPQTLIQTPIIRKEIVAPIAAAPIAVAPAPSLVGHSGLGLGYGDLGLGGHGLGYGGHGLGYGGHGLGLGGYGLGLGGHGLGYGGHGLGYGGHGLGLADIGYGYGGLKH